MATISLGFCLSALCYKISYGFTFLPVEMTIPLALFVFFLTLVMCTVSGMIVISKLKDAQPAEVFNRR